MTGLRRWLAAGLVAVLATAPDGALAEAEARYRELKDAEALRLVRELLKTQPNDVATRELEARCLVQLGRPAEALERLDAVPKPTFAGRLLLAECRAAVGDGPIAIALVDHVQRERPQLVDARLTRIRVLIEARSLRNASIEIAELRRTDPARADVVPLLARWMEAAKRYGEALEQWRSITSDPKRFEKLDPHVVRDAQEGVARIHFLRGEYEAASAAYGELVRGSPDRASFHYRLGMSQGMEKKSLDALASLERALALDPGFDECRYRLAELYRNKQMFDEALAEFERLHEVPAYRTDAARAIAELAARTGDLERAVACARELESVRPETADLLEARGLVAELSGERSAGLALYRRCLELDPLRFDVLYRLALLLVRGASDAERSEGAALMERYQRVVPVLPDVESAIQALRLAPDNPHWMIGLAGILNVAGEYPLARGWIERALEARGDDPLALGIAGCIAANQRRDAEALVLFERAQKLAGASPDAAVQGYIDALRKGEPLPLPIGELVRGKK